MAAKKTHLEEVARATRRKHREDFARFSETKKHSSIEILEGGFLARKIKHFEKPERGELSDEDYEKALELARMGGKDSVKWGTACGEGEALKPHMARNQGQSGHCRVRRAEGALPAGTLCTPIDPKAWEPVHPPHCSGCSLRGIERCCSTETSLIPDEETDHASHVFYYEATVIEGDVAIGVTHPALGVNKGATAAFEAGKSGGWMYHCSGDKYRNGIARPCGEHYGDGDRIGVLLDMDSGTLSFYKNGQLQGGGPAFAELPAVKLVAAVDLFWGGTVRIEHAENPKPETGYPKIPEVEKALKVMGQWDNDQTPEKQRWKAGRFADKAVKALEAKLWPKSANAVPEKFSTHGYSSERLRGLPSAPLKLLAQLRYERAHYMHMRDKDLGNPDVEDSVSMSKMSRIVEFQLSAMSAVGTLVELKERGDQEFQLEAFKLARVHYILACYYEIAKHLKNGLESLNSATAANTGGGEEAAQLAQDIQKLTELINREVPAKVAEAKAAMEKAIKTSKADELNSAIQLGRLVPDQEGLGAILKDAQAKLESIKGLEASKKETAKKKSS